jgi:hypothetical protein
MDNRINAEKTHQNRPVETDSEKIVRRHLENEDDEITDEDIRSVRVVTTDDEPTTISAEAEARFTEDSDKEITGSETDEKTGAPNADEKPGTSWNVLGE